MAEVKYAHRLPPCPDYDVAGVESWLEDLAREGLLLDKDTPFFGFYAFIRTAPQAVHYRLEPAIKTQSFWDGDPGKPKEEALSLYEEMGWEYITRYGDFYIYRSTDPHARELHTDADIQADALNVLRKRQRTALFGEILILAIYSLFGILRYPVGIIVALGFATALAFYGYFLIMGIKPLIVIGKLQKLRKAILSGASIHQKKSWKATALRYRVLSRIPEVLGLVILVGALLANIADDMQEIKLEDYTGDPPFVTIADLDPAGDYEMVGLTYANRMRRWESWPFVDIWDWYEFGSIQMADGTTLSGPLDVKYIEALSPGLARQLAKELIAYADTGKYFTEATPIDTGYENVRGFRYPGKSGLDTVLLICENKVVEAQVLVDNTEGVIAKEIWIRLMVERLISE